MKTKNMLLVAIGMMGISGVMLAGQTSIGWDTPYFQFAGINETTHGAPNIESFNAATAPNVQYYNGLPTLQDRTLQAGKYGMQVMYSFCTSGTPAGFVAGNNETVNPDMRNFQGFNYAQSFVYFGGASNEGEILVPSPGMILQAHKNGTPIFACIFFNEFDSNESSWINGTGSNQLGNSDYVNKTLAPQLELLAKTYHFDGYFINDEADSSTTGDNHFQPLVQDLLTSGLYVNWYYVYYTSKLTTMVGSKYYICADMGVNSSAYAAVDPSQRNNTDLEQDVTFNNYNVKYTPLQTTSTSYPSNHVTGSIYGGDFPAMSMTTQTNVSSGLLNEIDSYGLTKQLDGQVDLYIPNSGNRFITTFNTGSGNGYFVDGSSGSSGLNTSWNDESTVDYSPTVSSLRSGDITLDYSQAWLGGSSLSVKSNDVFTLFNTNFIPDSAAYVVVYYKGTLPDGAAISLNNTNYSITSTSLLPNDWHAFYVPVNSVQVGTTISAIGLVNCKGINIGKIYVGDSNSDTTTFIPQADGTTTQSWTPDSNAYQYLCYDSQGKLLAGTALPAYSNSALLYSGTPQNRTSKVATTNTVAKVVAVPYFDINQLS